MTSAGLPRKGFQAKDVRPEGSPTVISKKIMHYFGRVPTVEAEAFPSRAVRDHTDDADRIHHCRRTERRGVGAGDERRLAGDEMADVAPVCTGRNDSVVKTKTVIDSYRSVSVPA
jgi:hypothetical protein